MVFSRRPTAVGIDVCSNGGAVAVLWKNAGEPEVLCAESPAALLGDLRSKRVPWGNLRVVFPRKVLAVRQCELPSTETDEIRSMLAFELSDAPLFDGDSLFGFAFKDVVQKPGYSDVCAFLSSEQLAESFVRPLTEVGLVPEALLPSPAAVVAWMGAFADISGHGGETVLAVLVDATSMELVATRRWCCGVPSERCVGERARRRRKGQQAGRRGLSARGRTPEDSASADTDHRARELAGRAGGSGKGMLAQTCFPDRASGNGRRRAGCPMCSAAQGRCRRCPAGDVRERGACRWCGGLWGRARTGVSGPETDIPSQARKAQKSGGACTCHCGALHSAGRCLRRHPCL